MITNEIEQYISSKQFLTVCHGKEFVTVVDKNLTPMVEHTTIRLRVRICFLLNLDFVLFLKFTVIITPFLDIVELRNTHYVAPLSLQTLLVHDDLENLQRKAPEYEGTERNKREQIDLS